MGMRGRIKRPGDLVQIGKYTVEHGKEYGFNNE